MCWMCVVCWMCEHKQWLWLLLVSLCIKRFMDVCVYCFVCPALSAGLLRFYLLLVCVMAGGSKLLEMSCVILMQANQLCLSCVILMQAKQLCLLLFT